jgi:hypothetical protein
MKVTNVFYRKTVSIILMAVLPFMCYTASAQLKLYSKGNLSIGSIAQPPSNTELHVIGNTVFSKVSGTTTSSA